MKNGNMGTLLNIDCISPKDPAVTIAANPFFPSMVSPAAIFPCF